MKRNWRMKSRRPGNPCCNESSEIYHRAVWLAALTGVLTIFADPSLTAWGPNQSTLSAAETNRGESANSDKTGQVRSTLPFQLLIAIWRDSSQSAEHGHDTAFNPGQPRLSRQTQIGHI